MKNTDKPKNSEPISKEYFDRQLKLQFDNFARVVARGFADERNYMDERFEQVDKQFEQVDKQFEQADKQFEQVNKEIIGVKGESRSIRSEMRHEFAKVNQKIDEVQKSLKYLNQQRMIDIDAIGLDSIKHSKRLNKAEKNISFLDKRVAKLEVAK